MEYTNQYNEFVNIILDIIENTDPAPLSDKDKLIISQLYNDIINGMNEARQLIDSGNISIHTIHKNFNISSFSTAYVSKHIQDTISHNIVSQTIYKGHVHRQPITLNLSVIKGTLLSQSQLHNIAHKVFSWLYVCNKYAITNCKGINTIDIYFTDCKKIFPEHSTKRLTPDNINSGYSYVCSPENTIVIFRLEEWFKVFVHECMHSYGFQPISHNETVLNTHLTSLLSIHGPIKVCEAYVETWARIINTVYSAIDNSKNETDFYTIFDFTLQVESLFSIIQLSRVLTFMDISYKQVLDPTYTAAVYIESTNTFAYYVIGGVFMFNPYIFLNWCENNNDNILQFNNRPEGTSSFNAYMTRAMKHFPLTQIDRFSHLTKKKIGLRMTLADV